MRSPSASSIRVPDSKRADAAPRARRAGSPAECERTAAITIAQSARNSSSACSKPAALARCSSPMRRRQVDGGVEHQRPDPVGELLRVDRADHGAVGVAEVRQPVVAERGAEPIEVAGDVAAADPREPRAVAVDAVGDEVDGNALPS